MADAIGPAAPVLIPPPPLGRFGAYGGQFVPETVMPALDELADAAPAALADPAFQAELGRLLRTYAGRPTPTYFAERLTAHHRGAQLWLKREDLLHTGAHKLNNALGQVLLARRMGKRRIVAETGAGQHGVATATACARFDLPCVVYMGREDMRRQAVNVARMHLLGARVEPVDSGAGTLKDATSAAIRDWVTTVTDTHYVIGSVVGPHPYPWLVRTLQSVIGVEAQRQMLEDAGGPPHTVVACVGGGSNAIGIFSGFLQDPGVLLLGVEAGGLGLGGDAHAASLTGGRPGVLHGSLSYLLQDAEGQVRATHSISAGLDYPGVGPEHSQLHETGRARYLAVEDREALAAFHRCARLEGILPALETAHALAAAGDLAATLPAAERVLVCFSGRGDKDLDTVRDAGGPGSDS
ncbi:MAG TPA: tryptophan synthase subunit beta [Verrucomicrobiae bacterium]|nr:tryptophan synthase subunit beta [Verrucomicrobiae bacterium]